MTKPPVIHTLDLNFMGVPRTIAAYLIPHNHGAVLVECGPGSTLLTLKKRLDEYGYKFSDITAVLLTHIHLDHGGAAGHLARQGAQIYVHPNGAPHLLNPEKLLSSARRIYGATMDALWGEFLPVPADNLSVVEDNEVISIDALQFRALNTPGHAEHHYSYLLSGTCFTGDIAGVRLPGCNYISAPLPPPEFHLEKWRASLARLESKSLSSLALTHFGIFHDPPAHLAGMQRTLNEIEKWMLAEFPSNLTTDQLTARYVTWVNQTSRLHGLDPAAVRAYETANPSWMSGAGIQRYWSKFRNP